MENAIEYKEKFFTQYWGQDISCVRIDDAVDRKGFKVNLGDWRVKHEDSYLELTLISNITDV